MRHLVLGSDSFHSFMRLSAIRRQLKQRNFQPNSPLKPHIWSKGLERPKQRMQGSCNQHAQQRPKITPDSRCLPLTSLVLRAVRSQSIGFKLGASLRAKPNKKFSHNQAAPNRSFNLFGEFSSFRFKTTTSWVQKLGHGQHRHSKIGIDQESVRRRQHDWPINPKHF